jgi:diguanylate cyclase (GGDEF)-like protein
MLAGTRASSIAGFLAMPASLRIFVAAVSAAGLLLVGGYALRDGGALFTGADALLVTFAVAIVIAELFPLDLPGHDAQVTFSTTFAFALLLAEGTAAVVVVHALAVLLCDAVRRREPEKIAFNAGQYALSWAAAGGILHALAAPTSDRGGLEYGELAQLPGLAGAAVAFLLVNTFLASTPPALARRASPVAYVRADLGIHVTATTVLMAMVPVVLIVAAHDLRAIPLLGVPLAAIQRGGRQAVVNEQQAMHDMLTGLPNRAQLHERLGGALRDAAVRRRRVALLFMDLDGFKEINDTLGHQHGDLLLQKVADRLRGASREGDLVARLGGDEFAILLPDVSELDDCSEVARRMLDALKGQMQVQGVDLDVRASVGVACFPDHGHDVDTLLRRADMAMYKAKDARSGHELYDARLNEHTPERLALVGELRHAIEHHELLLEYQPKVALADGRVRGVEALVRWDHPEQGRLSPAEFVGLAEHTGLIRPLTMWVARAAVRQTQQWRADGLDLPVAVNLSARSLTRDLPEDLAVVLTEYGAAGSDLELELTETTMMANPEEALEVLEALAALGIRLSVDDFGTGYSSLGYLKRLPVSEIKIDRSFVRDMDVDTSDRGIVRSTIDLARHLQLDVVAEGVESAAVLSELQELGCTYAQGFFISRPLAAEAVTSWVREHSESRLPPGASAPDLLSPLGRSGVVSPGVS